MLLPAFIASQSPAKRGAILRSLTSGGSWWQDFEAVLDQEALRLEGQKKLRVWRDGSGFYYARFHFETVVCAPPMLMSEIFGTAADDGEYMERLESELVSMGRAIAEGREYKGEWLEAAALYRRPDVARWQAWHAAQVRVGVLERVTGW